MIIIKQLADHLKVLFAVLIVLVLGTLSAVRLMKIQVVGDEEIVNVTNSNDDTFSFSKVISPTRGEIVDLNGNHIIYNTTGNNVILEKAFFPEDNQMGNRVLLETYKILKNNGYEYMLGRKGFLPAMRYVDNYIIGKESIELCVESLVMLETRKFCQY